MKKRKLYNIAFMGDKDHGCDIISTLESWGGSNYFSRIGNDPEYAYFINDLGTIDLIHNSAFLSEEMKNFYFMFWHDYSIECHLKVGETINYGGQDYEVDSIFFDANNRCIVYKLKSFGIGVEYITNNELIPTEKYQTEEENNEYLFKNNMKTKLAIKGHATRGKKVIKLLEMMGGKNKYYYKCNEIRVGFTIGSDGSICRVTYNLHDEFRVFTLEEFLEKYPFKVGDKAVYEDDNDIVVISEIKWDDTVGDIFYNVKRIDEDDCFLCPPELLKPYKETNKNKFGTAKEPLKPKPNAVKLVDGKVVDDLEKMSVKNHKMGPKSKLPSKYYEDRLEEIQSNQDIDKTNNNLNGNEYPIMEGVKCNEYIKYSFPDGYEFVDTDYTGVYLKPIKPKYPTNYDECNEIMDVEIWNTLWGESATKYEEQTEKLINALIKLKICRDAYWKIAGEEMGLDKPWEPNWTTFEGMPAIFRFRYNIVCGSIKNQHCLLVFPTEEMRDAFYENFKDLIEQCKELL